MARRLQEYVNYTTKELDQYTQVEGSCVRKVNTNLHLSMGPFCLSDFKHVLKVHIVRSKVGFYDVQLDGIVLDVKKIKVLGTTGAIRADDPRIHVNIQADVYIFKPEEGAELTGIVKHIGPHQVGVILYRVFNANLRVAHKVDKSEVQMDQEAKFRIRKYNLQNVFPYIEGELLTPGSKKNVSKVMKFESPDDNADSGIEEKDGTQDLDDLLSVIKIEAPSEYEEALEESNKKKSNKSKKDRANCGDSVVAKTPLRTDIKKSSKKRKSPSCTASDTADENSTLSTNSVKKIKRELNFSGDSLTLIPKKIKKETDESHTKQTKSKIMFSDGNVKIKKEVGEHE